MSRLNYSDVAQTLIDQDAIEPPPRDYVLYKMDVSDQYRYPEIGSDDDPIADAYYALSPGDENYEGVVVYIATKWDDGEIVDDENGDLCLSRATQVHRIDQLDENDVVPTFKKWLEGV